MSEAAIVLDHILRVAIVADDPARRASLSAIVADRGLAAAASPETADVILVDGDAASEAILGTPVVILGDSDESTDVQAQLSRDATPDQIAAALRAVATGLIVRMPERGFDQLAEESLGELLTPREIEVLTAVSEGLGNKAIARRLDISLHTVKFHLESIFRKLGVGSRAEAVARGLRRVNL